MPGPPDTTRFRTPSPPQRQTGGRGRPGPNFGDSEEEDSPPPPNQLVASKYGLHRPALPPFPIRPQKDTQKRREGDSFTHFNTPIDPMPFPPPPPPRPSSRKTTARSASPAFVVPETSSDAPSGSQQQATSSTHPQRRAPFVPETSSDAPSGSQQEATSSTNPQRRTLLGNVYPSSQSTSKGGSQRSSYSHPSRASSSRPHTSAAVFSSTLRHPPPDHPASSSQAEETPSTSTARAPPTAVQARVNPDIAQRLMGARYTPAHAVNPMDEIRSEQQQRQRLSSGTKNGGT